MPTAAEILARGLYEAGCRHAFGIPGGEVLTVMHALDDAGIKFALAKHENPAGFMAEGTYHMTGAPGILVATLGPGVANAVNVVANAEQDRVPLIFLTGRVDDVDSVSYTHQVFDHVALLKSVTKGSFTLVSGAVETIVEKAVTLALEGRPGPVHIDVPISLAAAEQAGTRAIRPYRAAASAPARRRDVGSGTRGLSGGAAARHGRGIGGPEPRQGKGRWPISRGPMPFRSSPPTRPKGFWMNPTRSPWAVPGSLPWRTNISWGW